MENYVQSVYAHFGNEPCAKNGYGSTDLRLDTSTEITKFN
jgi:hypothetical protein